MSEVKKSIQLSDHFDYKTLLRFTVPSILMMVISSVYSIVDGLFVSNFAGSDGFAAVNLIMPIAMMISCVGFMAGAGGSALVSKTLGEKREDDAREQFSLVVYLIIAFSVVIGAGVFSFIPQISKLMGAEGAIYENCVIYGRILIAALPAFLLQILFQNFLVVAERPQMGMVIAISSGVVNIIFDALFVAVFKWGVAGAAIATVMGQMIGGLVPLFYFLMKKNDLLWFVKAKWNGGTIIKVAVNGFSAFISNASASLLGIIFNLRLMALIGSDGVVAYGVVMYVNYIVSGVFMGYSTGIAPVFSYNLGAKIYEEIKGLFKKSLAVITISSVALFAVTMLSARMLAAFFVSYDDGLMTLTTEAIRLYGLSFLVCGYNYFAASLFAALNKGGVSSILSLTRTLVFQMAMVFVLPLLIGNDGIWLSVLAAEVLSVMVAFFFIAKNRKKYCCAALFVIVLLAAAVGMRFMGQPGMMSAQPTAEAPEGELTLDLDNTAWNYDADNDVYWQMKVYYCTAPVAYDYQTMGIYVPGAYFTGVKNADGTYTCTVNEAGTAGSYSARTAPIVFPVNTAGYSAQAAPTSYRYEELSEYLENGFVYVYAGMRGRDNGENADGSTYSGGAPLGVTDLKAAVRFYRYNESVLPGNVDAVFTFGHSGGGAQSAIMGAAGDSELYDPYLETIGAAMTDKNGNSISDAIMGAMCWCPITALDGADAAYEWNMGQYFSDGTRADGKWTAALSDDLAESYAEFINGLHLRDSEGNELVLEKSEEGIYASGTYYEYLLQEVEESLNNYLADNAAQESIDKLNRDEKWIVYDEETNTVSISDMGAFARHCKKASKDVAAFDDLNRGQAENRVFGNGENNALHYDFILYDLLVENAEEYAQMKSWDASLPEAYGTDLAQTDDLGTDSRTRQNMYNPMYYVSDAYEGYGTSTVAPYWRIRSGIEQGDTALCTELNLALALEHCENTADVDFAMVWGEGHTTAERTGSGTANFIEWVNACMEDFR